MNDNSYIYQNRIGKIKIVDLALIFVSFLMVISMIFGYSIKFLSYVDEVCAITFLLLLFYNAIVRKITLDYTDRKIIFMLSIIIIIGFLSNAFSNLISNYFLILLDALSFTKVFIGYFAIKYLFSKNSINTLVNISSIICKFLLIVALLLGVISQFIDIGMRGQLRYGLYGFNFVFEYAHEFEVFLIFCVSIILVSNSKYKDLYLFLTCILLFMSLKGPSFVLSFLLLYLLYYFKYQSRIKLIHFIIPFIIILFLSSYQIETYFMNENSARSILIKYGFITANNYFPFGSGLSTYGSSTAFINYSNLYVQYGFDSLYGMNSIDGSFLNDNYFPMVVAQFGYFGLVLIIMVFIQFFKKALCDANRFIKTLLLAIIAFCMVHSLGSALLTSSAGFMCFLTFAIVEKMNDQRGIL